MGNELKVERRERRKTVQERIKKKVNEELEKQDGKSTEKNPCVERGGRIRKRQSDRKGKVKLREGMEGKTKKRLKERKIKGGEVKREGSKGVKSIG